MQTAGPRFPEVKITASVCTQSHFEPRQTPLIWRLLAPALTSCFMGARKWREKNWERRNRTGGTSEPALFCRTTPIYLPESSRPIGWGRVPRPAFSRRRTTKTDCLESVSKKKRNKGADSRRCVPSPARATFLKRTQFACVRQMEQDYQGTSAHPTSSPPPRRHLAFCFFLRKCQILLTRRYLPACGSTDTPSRGRTRLLRERKNTQREISSGKSEKEAKRRTARSVPLAEVQPAMMIITSRVISSADFLLGRVKTGVAAAAAAARSWLPIDSLPLPLL